MNVAPPARNSAATSSTLHPARVAASSSRIALRGESGDATSNRFGEPATRGRTRGEALHERCAQFACDEVFVRKDLQMHRDARLDAFDDGHLERAAHAGD